MAATSTATQPNIPSPLTLRQTGRKLRPIRIIGGLSYLICLSQREDHLAGYDNFARAVELKSHWERSHLLGHILAICVENDWSLYPILVRPLDPNDPKGKALQKVTGSGFYTEYNRLTGKNITPNQQVWTLMETNRCQNGDVPATVTMITRVLDYLVRNQLI
jgi:hypothetical protein